MKCHLLFFKLGTNHNSIYVIKGELQFIDST